MDPLIEAHRGEIVALAKGKGLENVRVFGSMARGDADEKSDIDLLVTLAPDTSGLAPIGLELEVRKLLGREVDVVTEGCLHDMLRDRVLREAKPL